MTLVGPMRKMQTTFASPVEYELPIGDNIVPMNQHIGKELLMRYTGEIICVTCGRPTRKSFSQGHCFPCFRSHPECSPCIIHPEKCRAQ